MTDEEAALEVVWLAHEGRALRDINPETIFSADEGFTNAGQQRVLQHARRVEEYQCRKGALLRYLLIEEIR